MSTKKFFDFSKPEDIEEAHRLIFEEDDVSVEVPDENFDESDESDSDDQVETRSVDSNTDHEISDDEGESEEPEVDDYYFSGKYTKASIYLLFV